MKRIRFIIFIFLLIPLCGKKNKDNYVPLEQLNIDKSNDYKYIFKDIIEEQREREKREKKDPFKD